MSKITKYKFDNDYTKFMDSLVNHRIGYKAYLYSMCSEFDVEQQIDNYIKQSQQIFNSSIDTAQEYLSQSQNTSLSMISCDLPKAKMGNDEEGNSIMKTILTFLSKWVINKNCETAKERLSQPEPPLLRFVQSTETTLQKDVKQLFEHTSRKLFMFYLKDVPFLKMLKKDVIKYNTDTGAYDWITKNAAFLYPYGHMDIYKNSGDYFKINGFHNVFFFDDIYLDLLEQFTNTPDEDKLLFLMENDLIDDEYRKNPLFSEQQQLSIGKNPTTENSSVWGVLGGLGLLLFLKKRR